MPEQNEVEWQKADLYVSEQAKRLEPGLKKTLDEWFRLAQPPIAPELEEERPTSAQKWHFPKATLVYQDPFVQGEQRIPVSVSAGVVGKDDEKVVMSLNLGAIHEREQVALPVALLEVLTRMTYGLDCLAANEGERVPEKFEKAGFLVRWSRQDLATGETFRVPEIDRVTVGFGQTPETFAQALANLSNHHMRLELGNKDINID